MFVREPLRKSDELRNTERSPTPITAIPAWHGA